MPVWWGGELKITHLNGTILGTAVTVGYRRFELNDDPRLADAATVLNPGSRMAPTQVHNEWRVELPHDTASLPEAVLLLKAGNVLTFDWTVNPSAPTLDKKKYTLANTTVGPGRRASGTDDINRFESSGAGGDITYPAAS